MNKPATRPGTGLRGMRAPLPAMLCATLTACAVAATPPDAPASEAAGDRAPASSAEQGQTSLEDSFDWDFRAWRLEKRREALRATTFKSQLRTMYLDRDKYDDTSSEAWAIGGYAGLKTGYFLDHLAFGATGYTSQHLFGEADEDGTLLLEPGQEGYSVLGELYADLRITDDVHLYTVVGVQMSLIAGLSTAAAVIVGIISAAGGGLLRDLLAGDEPLLLKPGQFYILAALAGGLAYLACQQIYALRGCAAALAIALVFVIRILAIQFNWSTAPVSRWDRSRREEDE